MRIPESIQRSHILKALQAVRHGKVPARRKAKKYYLLFEGRTYPAKYALSLAYTFISPRGLELRGFEGGKQTNGFLQSRGFTIVDARGKKIGRNPAMRSAKSPIKNVGHGGSKGSENSTGNVRKFWIVSPNVRDNDQTVLEWRQASVTYKSAFMGYHPSDENHKQIGYKFAHAIQPNDVILIARRHRGNIEVVGFGVVKGKFRRRLKGLIVPQPFGSLRRLSPFVALSSVPHNIPLASALRHTMALRQLRPWRSKAERIICEWMERRLQRRRIKKEHQPGAVRQLEVLLADLIQNDQLEYQVRNRRTVARAKKREAILLAGYSKWLGNRNRKLHTVKYRNLRCDAYEKERNNLIEAKSSTRREHLRMAVGELLDYSYLGRGHFRNPNLAILLPARPDSGVEEWLSKLHIGVLWKKRDAFLDNANGQFT